MPRGRGRERGRERDTHTHTHTHKPEFRGINFVGRAAGVKVHEDDVRLALVQGGELRTTLALHRFWCALCTIREEEKKWGIVKI